MLAPLLPDLTALGALVTLRRDGARRLGRVGAGRHRAGADRRAAAGPHHRQPEAARRPRAARGRTHRGPLSTSPSATSGSWTRSARASSASTAQLRISFVNPPRPRCSWAGTADELLGQDACVGPCAAKQHDECLVSMVMALGEAVTQSARSYRRKRRHGVPGRGDRVAEGRTYAVSTAPSSSSATSPSATVLDEMKRQFVSAVSHELRTPLTAIRGSLEMLADGDAGSFPPEAQRVVDVASRGTERLTRLVNDIIDIERLEAGSFERPAAAGGHRPAGRSRRPTRFLALADERRVNLVIGEAGGSALCDADRIVQALINLIGNALKFTQPGGTVRVSATPMRARDPAQRQRRGSRHPGRGPRRRSSSGSTRSSSPTAASSAAPDSACRSPRPSWNGTADGSGWRASWASARRSASRCRC